MSMTSAQNNLPNVIIGGNVLLYESKAPYEISGSSLKGAIEYDQDEDKIRCHECGEWFNALPSHLKKHEISVADYKEKHGLSQRAALMNERLRKIRVDSGKAHAFTGSHLSAMSKMRTHRPKQQRSANTAERENSTRICPVQLLDRLDKLAKSLRRTPSVAEIKAAGMCAPTLSNRFGSLAKAMRLCGLTANKAGTRNPYSKGQLIALLRNFVDTRGYAPSQSDCRRGLLPAVSTYRSHFGNWGTALRKIGINPHKGGSTKLKAVIAASEQRVSIEGSYQ